MAQKKTAGSQTGTFSVASLLKSFIGPGRTARLPSLEVILAAPWGRGVLLHLHELHLVRNAEL